MKTEKLLSSRCYIKSFIESFTTTFVLIISVFRKVYFIWHIKYTLNGISGIGIPELLMIIMSCNGFV